MTLYATVSKQHHHWMEGKFYFKQQIKTTTAYINQYFYISISFLIVLYKYAAVVSSVIICGGTLALTVWHVGYTIGIFLSTHLIKDLGEENKTK